MRKEHRDVVDNSNSDGADRGAGCGGVVVLCYVL